MERSGQFVTPFDFVGRLSLRQAIPLGLQHVLAMFVGNLTPILIITNLCAATSGAEDFAAIQVVLLQNAMLVAGLVTLVQLFAIGPVGGKVPIIMGTSSGFIGVFQSVVNVMGGGIVAYGTIMGASILGGLFETVLGAFLKPLRRFFPAVVTGTVVLSIGLSLISVGVASFGGGSGAELFNTVLLAQAGEQRVLVACAAQADEEETYALLSQALNALEAGYFRADVTEQARSALDLFFNYD